MNKSIENQNPHRMKMKVSNINTTLEEFIQMILKNKIGLFNADYSRC